MLRNKITSGNERDICRFCLNIQGDNSTPVLPGFFNDMLKELSVDMVNSHDINISYNIRRSYIQYLILFVNHNLKSPQFNIYYKHYPPCLVLKIIYCYISETWNIKQSCNVLLLSSENAEICSFQSFMCWCC